MGFFLDRGIYVELSGKFIFCGVRVLKWLFEKEEPMHQIENKIKF